MMIVRPQTPHRAVPFNQESYTHLFRFTLLSPRASPQEARYAAFIYFQILHDCSTLGLTVDSFQSTSIAPPRRPARAFFAAADIKIDKLYNALYVNSPTEPGKTNLVRMILHGMFCPSAVSQTDRSLTNILPFASRWPTLTPAQRQPLFFALVYSARDILFRFFVPLMAEGGATTPASSHLSPPGGLGGPDQGTPSRDRSLSSVVRRRDGHRCVVSGMYDNDYLHLEECAGRAPPDEDAGGTTTDAAHIIPHALNSAPRGTDIDPAQQFVWGILNMFDTGIRDELAGANIDDPRNALLLAHDLHVQFGKLRVYFEKIPGEVHCYRFRKTRGARRLRRDCNPKSDVLMFVNCEKEGVERATLPSARLLKMHMACCKMLEMAGAAEYVESLLRDREEMEVKGTLAEDGSSEVEVLWALKGLETGLAVY